LKTGNRTLKSSASDALCASQKSQVEKEIAVLIVITLEIKKPS
jgi:hypothetical protein